MPVDGPRMPGVLEVQHDQGEETPIHDRELMALRANTLFRYDARGRMVCSNEPDGQPAPRVFLGCTADSRVVRFGQTVPDSLAQRVAEAVERQPMDDRLRVPAPTLTAVREALERHAPVSEESGGPAFRFPEPIPRAGGAVQVTDSNLAVVRATCPWLITELAEWWPCFAVVHDGAAVSVCFSSRIGADACEAGVEIGMPAAEASRRMAAWRQSPPVAGDPPTPADRGGTTSPAVVRAGLGLCSARHHLGPARTIRRPRRPTARPPSRTGVRAFA